jgi:hypothetical protein
MNAKTSSDLDGIGPVRTLFRRAWMPIHSRWRSIESLRFTIGLLLVGTLLITVVPQGRDVMATLADSWAPGVSSRSQWWWFVAAVIFLGLQAWLWSRMLVQLRHGKRRDWRKDRLLVHLPRLLGVVPYFAAAFALARIPQGHFQFAQAAFLFVLGCFAYLFYWKRLALIARVASWKLARAAFQDQLSKVPLTRFEAGLLILSLAMSAGSLVWLMIDPVTLPSQLGSAAIAYLGFGLVLPGVNLLLALTWRERFPAITALLLTAFLASFFNDNHEVRSLPGNAATIAARPSLEAGFRRWLAQAPRATDDPTVVPIVFVSAAGGASRAALWTLASLQRLDSADAEFNRSIFAITAVSGSALGAVDYVAAIKADRDNDPKLRQAIAWKHAGSDFLAPAIAGLFYTDMVQRFVPFPLFRDRSWSIERGFEEQWDLACEGASRWSHCAGLLRGDFLSLWQPDGRWQPNLLLVGTIEEDGRRVVTSNLDLIENIPAERMGKRIDWPRPLLPNVYDYFRLTGRPIAASTAVMNSARFPWVSPAGGIVGRDGTHMGHIIDGGYFEASAADTTLDLAAAVQDVARRLCQEDSALSQAGRSPEAPRQGEPSTCVRLRPIFITLLNDEMVDSAKIVGQEDICDPDARRLFADGRIVPAERLRPAASKRSLANDLLAPLYGLFSTQGSRAEITLARLARIDPSDARERVCLRQ